jgi:hypothetical protein
MGRAKAQEKFWSAISTVQQELSHKLGRLHHQRHLRPSPTELSSLEVVHPPPRQHQYQVR